MGGEGMTKWIVLGALLVAAGAVTGCVLRERWLYRQLDRLLDAAIRGEFDEKTFDESLLSRLESKLYRFLNASSLSAKNLAADRARIAELVSDISHQTKTPIANILLYTQLLQEQKLDDESRVLAAQIGGQTEKLRFLVQSLVKTSRLENGLVAVHPGEYELSALCGQLETDIAARAGKKGVTVIWNVPEGLTCRFDPKWTEEAVFNLLDNAVKYTPAGGTVTVSANTFEMFCCLSVSDTGVGIAEEEQAKIFERFYRSPSVAQEEGVGIGLYLARRIISAEGGYIKVKSGGEGTTFSVFLPK